MKRAVSISAVLVLGVFIGGPAARAAEGDLDAGFGTAGKVSTPIGTAADLGQSLAIQADGKIVVAGYARVGATDDFAVARYNANGSLDTTFDTDGKVTTAFGAGADQGQAVAIQTDGKIVVAGTTFNGTSNDFAVARYNANGSLDTTFDTDGRASVSFGNNNDDGYAVALQSDGKILLAGTVDQGPRFDIGVARLTTAGALDATFNGGTATVRYGGQDSGGRAVAVQSDGAVIVAGVAATNANDDFAAARLTSAGVLDPTFDADGKAITQIGAGADQGQSLVLQADGKIVVAGTSNNGTNDDFALARYTTTGALDTTFDTDGKVTTAIGTGNDLGQGVALQADGKILVAGISNNGVNDDFALARYTTTGALDPAFGTGGKVTTAIGTGADLGQAVATAPDTDIVIAGYASNGANNDFALARYVGDQTPPNTSIDSGPSGTVNTTSATFTLSSPDVSATFQCQIDGGAYAACASPKSYSGLSQGSHTFSVKAIDPAGNEDPSPATRTWSVDTVAPDTSISTGPSGTVGTTSATFTFTSTEAGSSFECRLDGAVYSACVSPLTYPGITDGPHTFDVRATDTAGNTDPSPASRTWSVDTLPPDTSIDSGPSGTVNTTSATFTLSSPDVTATFQCELDSLGWSPCTSPANYSGLADGIHTFRAKAIDGVGNEDATAASRTWTIDVVGPTTAITSGPSGLVSSASAAFTFVANEPGSTYECALDAAAFAPCVSPVAYSALSEGSHTFEVRATDPVGNVEATPASRTWTVDTVAPDTSIDSGPSGTTAATNATFTFSSPDVTATFRCRLDAAAYSPCISPLTYNALPEGSHTFQVKAVDPAGNEDPTPAAGTWTVDNTLPDTSIDSGPAALVNSTSATLAFSSSEPGSTFECRLDGAPFAACTSPTGYTGLGDGSHTFDVAATDAAGNTDGSPATSTWTVDTVAPDTSLDPSGPTGSTVITDASFGFTSPDDATAGFMCDLDGAGYAACTSPHDLSGLAVGDHTFSVKAVDPAGNEDPTPASRTWTIIPPIFQPDAMIKSLTSATYLGDGIYSPDGAGQTIKRKLRGGSTASFGLAVSNHGNVPDSATVKGCKSIGVWQVSYAAGVDVTGAVVAGTHSVGLLAPGTDNRLTMGIRAKAKAKHGATISCAVTATSAGDGTSDTVKVIITVK